MKCSRDNKIQVFFLSKSTIAKIFFFSALNIKFIDRMFCCLFKKREINHFTGCEVGFLMSNDLTTDELLSRGTFLGKIDNEKSFFCCRPFF